jgi:aspartyl-tRNA(Asn)/glutamyl-tRNA(Gln) amidotransferase subunit B
LDIEVKGATKSIGITRIHIEEDAGKLIHQEGLGTLVDYNRAGVPLIEIVSEPDLRSAEEVKAYLQKLRAIMLYIGVSDVKMNEGSFRCDVNLSVREKGSDVLGVRTEIKNLNSFQSIMRAIDYESQRHIRVLEEGGTLVQETRGFDQTTGKTYSMREKEDAEDYRYLPDPDLMPIVIDDAWINSIKDSLPELPDERKDNYIREYGLSSYDAEQLVASKDLADYFEEAVKLSKNTKTLANLLISEIFRFIDLEDFEEPFPAEYLGELVNLIEDGVINISTSKRIIEEMRKSSKSPKQIVKEQDLEQINDRDILSPIIDEAIANSEKAVKEYRAGKEKALGAIIGQIMRATSGKANPQFINEILIEKLKRQ